MPSSSSAATEASSQDEIQDILDNTLAMSTRQHYDRSIARFVEHLRVHAPACVTTDAANPIDLDALQADPGIFHTFLVSLKSVRAPSLGLGYSALNTYRSALSSYFRRRNLAPVASFSTAVSNFFKGIQRKQANERAQGDRQPGDGKIPITFRLHCAVSRSLLVSLDASAILTHCFLVCTWNLMCRCVVLARAATWHSLLRVSFA